MTDDIICPTCEEKGAPVKPITLESLLIEPKPDQLSGFRFCATNTCATAYYNPDTGMILDKSLVKVRIGLKESTAPRRVCYCFEHDQEDIEAEVIEHGASGIADDITAKCKKGLHRCEEMNPQGRCCLGNIRRIERAAQAQGEIVVAQAQDDCCAVPDKAETPASSPSRAGTWASVGALASAVMSSACCWLPLLLIGLGFSAGGIGGIFDAYRPHLLGITALLLGFAFYLTYFRSKLADQDCCDVPNRRLIIFNKVMLWGSTGLVAAFAFFPSYVGSIISATADADPPKGQQEQLVAATQVDISVEGMTCEACAVHVRSELEKIEGVQNASVSYPNKRATVSVIPGTDAEQLLGAVRSAGYTGRLVNGE